MVLAGATALYSSVLCYSCGAWRLRLQLMLSLRRSWNTRAARAPMSECMVPAPATHAVHADRSGPRSVVRRTIQPRSCRGASTLGLRWAFTEGFRSPMAYG